LLLSNQETKKVRERQLAAPLESTTLQKLVKSELATKKHTATEGLLWLVRGLDFCAQALRADINAGGSQELSTSFRGAYKNTLAPYHSFLVKPVFSAAMSATPYRKDFAAKVAGDSSNTAKAEEDMKVWVAALEENVGILKEFLASNEAKW
jgi:Glycolipid transfer protein (GLTP)